MLAGAQAQGVNLARLADRAVVHKDVGLFRADMKVEFAILCKRRSSANQPEQDSKQYSRGQITFRLHEDFLFKDRSSQEFVRITCRQWQRQCQTREMKKILLNKLNFNTVTDGRLLERWLSRPARQTYSSSRAKSLPTWAANTTPKHSESHVIADTRCVRGWYLDCMGRHSEMAGGQGTT